MRNVIVLMWLWTSWGQMFGFIFLVVVNVFWLFFFFPLLFLILRFVSNRDFLDGLLDVVNFGVWFVETDQQNGFFFSFSFSFFHFIQLSCLLDPLLSLPFLWSLGCTYYVLFYRKWKCWCWEPLTYLFTAASTWNCSFTIQSFEEGRMSTYPVCVILLCIDGLRWDVVSKKKAGWGRSWMWTKRDHEWASFLLPWLCLCLIPTSSCFL